VRGSEQRWNEPEAILLLERAGKLVEVIEASGARITHSERKLYHNRLVTAHDTQDMAAYRTALEEYVEGARKAYQKVKRGRQG
jgi:hypothetical protein